MLALLTRRRRFSGLAEQEILAVSSDENDGRIYNTLAIAVVFVELWSIACNRSRYRDMPFLRAALQVMPKGAPVLAAGIVSSWG